MITNEGEFSIWYRQHRFPIDPSEYPRILGRANDHFTPISATDELAVLELQSLSSAFSHLPKRTSTTPEEQAERYRDKEIHKRRLADLCVRSAHVAALVSDNLRAINGVSDDSSSFEELHELIKTQAFRLAYWRVAADDINYRRFFDINDLAGLRMENEHVFEATHGLVMQLVREGKVNGLRIDHPDGLFDPAQYFRRLQQCRPSYVVAEKILMADELLPTEWPLDGTTGYDFSKVVNGLFVEVSSATKMVKGYKGFLGHSLNFRNVLYSSKTTVMDNALASELNVLANILSRIALSNRHTCDFTLNRLREALSEIVAHFPVYRTYLTQDNVSERDRSYIEAALAAAKRQSTSQDTSVYEFIRHVLLDREGEEANRSDRRGSIAFAMKFQQFTGPVMAKSLEDTSFYRYHPLTSLNDVGGDPMEFGVTVEDFHARMQARSKTWPHSMLSTSTHDSKLSEDVRARINVLSEIPARWRLKARQWRMMNRAKKTTLGDVESPSRNDEYLFYQVLLGAWPAGICAPTDELRRRFKSYMLKAAREAKEFTSWANQNAEYENALTSFVDEVLNSDANQEFLSDFLAFQRDVARAGMFNTLSQTLIKLTAPGVPDIYQGNDVCEFHLVDPDNRSPVDYSRRKQLLSALTSLPCSEHANLARALTAQLLKGEDLEGQAKLFVTWKALRARQRYPDIFQRGEYVPLTVEGPRQANIVAFARQSGHSRAVIAVPRMCARFLEGDSCKLCSRNWEGTRINLPTTGTSSYRNIMTGEKLVPTRGADEGNFLDVSALMKDFLWTVLVAEEPIGIPDVARSGCVDSNGSLAGCEPVAG